jgi:hypothetical protein
MKICTVGLMLALCCLAQIEDSPSGRLRLVEQLQVAASELGTLRPGDDKDVRTLIVDIDPKRFGFPPGYADRSEIERDLLIPFSSMIRPSLCKVGFRTLHTNWGSVLGWDFRLDCSENQEKPAEKTAPETVNWREQLLGKPVTLRSVRSIFGSEQEFDAPILCRLSDLLKFNEFGVGDGHAFGLQQQVADVLIAATTID